MVKVVDKEEGGGLSSWDSQCYIISNICIQLLLPSQPPHFYRLTTLDGWYILVTFNYTKHKLVVIAT